MTYVLVIGSSHVAAYRAAAEAFTAMHPGITLSFFGVRGPLFFGGRVDKAGVFKVPLRDDKDRAFVKRTNGTTRIDTTGADHLLMVGHRFAFPGFPVLLESMWQDQVSGSFRCPAEAGQSGDSQRVAATAQ